VQQNKKPSWKEVQEVIKKARASSTPGSSGNCPRLLHRLWRILKVIWRRGKVAHQWRYAEGARENKEDPVVLWLDLANALRVHTTQAGRRGTEPASYTRQVQGPHPGLL